MLFHSAPRTPRSRDAAEHRCTLRSSPRRSSTDTATRPCRRRVLRARSPPLPGARLRRIQRMHKSARRPERPPLPAGARIDPVVAPSARRLPTVTPRMPQTMGQDPALLLKKPITRLSNLRASLLSPSWAWVMMPFTNSATLARRDLAVEPEDVLVDDAIDVGGVKLRKQRWI